MNRREFWSVITGGLLGVQLGWYKDPSEMTSIDLAAIDPESFMKFILEDERWMSIRKDIWSGHTDIGWSLNGD